MTTASDMVSEVVFGGANRPTLASCEVSLALRGRSFLRDADFTPGETLDLLATAKRLKAIRTARQPHTYLSGKTLGLVFQHPSTRTRTAFQVGMEQLGGQAIFLGASDLQLKRGETLADSAAVMKAGRRMMSMTGVATFWRAGAGGRSTTARIAMQIGGSSASSR